MINVAIAGFGTVYTGLESAAKALERSLAIETVEVVTHKYADLYTNVILENHAFHVSM